MKEQKTKSETNLTDRRGFVINAIIIGVLAAVIVSVGAYGGIRSIVAKDVFAENIEIDGTRLGGLTYEQGKQKVLELQQEKLAGIRIPVRYKDAEKSFGAEELGVSINTDEKLRQAYSYNRQNKSFSDNYNRTFAEVKLQTDISIDRDMLEQSLNSFISEYEKGAVNASVQFDEDTQTMEYVEGSNGAKADREKAIHEVEERVLSGSNEPVIVSEEEMEPEYSTEYVKENTVLIGECTTDITDSDENRLENISKVCSMLNGVAVQPGDRLSINELTGERTQEKGYLPASTISDGNPGVSVMGAGVSQVAGTLYNAALRADMDIVERVRHSWPSDYLEVGLDADISWEDKDLIIANGSDFPVYIGAKASDSLVTVKLFGQPPDNEIKIKNNVLQEIEPPEEKTVPSDEYPSGSTQVTQAARTGYEVEVYRNYVQNGVLVEREKISYDYFPEMGKITTTGTG